TGYLGRFIVAELHRRGYQVRALVRDLGRAESPGIYGSPSLTGTGLVADWRIGDVTNPRVTADLAHGVAGIISALGVTRQKADPWDIDYRANLAILNSARRHGVNNFCYVHALGAEHCPARITRAKTAFVRELQESEITAQVISPTGYFSDMAQVLDMARRGRVVLLDDAVRINPIHGLDVAGACVDRHVAEVSGEWRIGGPEVLTWREVAECAFRALGRPARITVLPRVARGLLVRQPWWDGVRFAAWSMTHDSVGESIGRQRLLDFYNVILA
ncbi:MAG: NAD(P)H-binding protein, partial [Corynebacterium matruchotii]